MKTKIFFTAIMLFAFSVKAQWTSVTSGTTNFLTSAQGISATINFAAGFSGTVLKSTNSGQTWTALTSPVAANINNVFFVPTGTAQTGWAATVQGLFKTTNGGANWTQQISGAVFADLLFPDVNTGIALTSSSNLRRTTNGGTNFTQINFTTNSAIHGGTIVLGNSTTYFLLGLDNVVDTSYVFKSTNAGVNWTQAAKFPLDYFSMAFVNSSTGIICGDNGIMKRTTNGGTNWSTINTGTTNDLQGLKFATSTKVYCAGSGGTILKSTDAGVTWVQQVSGTSSALRGLDVYATDDIGFAAGANGTIVRTTNGGVTGFVQNVNEVPENYSLQQNYPNPFNPSTNIKFSIMQSGFVQVKVYDVLGKERAIVVSQELSAGTYRTDFDASDLPSGTYFYRLTVSGNSGQVFTETKKMILIK